MLHTRKLEGTFEFDGDEYEWELRREPQWCTTDGYRGMLIAIRSKAARGREALLQFPFPKWGARRSDPHRQRPQVQRQQLEQGVRVALEVGWEPSARGKPFHVQLERP
jgi:hypothetical protein